jgi:DNA modification methylase
MESKPFQIHHGDCVDVLASMDENSIDCTISSVPYLSLYVYSASERDIGNCATDEEFWEHFKFVMDGLFRVTKPGRLVAIDCLNVPAMKGRDGYIGLKDFRGDLIRGFIQAGFIFHSEHCIWKDPLIDATRTKAIGLLHKQLCKDSSMSRAGIPQYLLAFRKPGENAVPIKHEKGIEYFIGEDEPTTRDSENVEHKRWQRYASPVWMDIRLTRTLNATSAREDEDERHLCPLAFDIIERAMFLWSNPGDVVLDPFMGIGSTGVIAIQEKRRFYGIELKKSYWDQSKANLEAAVFDLERQLTLI